MLLSIALIFLIGLGMGYILEKLKLPRLLGMLAAGIVLGPFALNLIDESILAISPEIRRTALVIILTHAGLGLNLSELKKTGRTAVLLCFVPALFEIGGYVLTAPLILGISHIEAALLGSVIAAVSPAVIVPKMLNLIEKNYKSGIPQMIMAAASVDDVFVIVLFSIFTELARGNAVSLAGLLKIPCCILTGIAAGTALGMALTRIFVKIKINPTIKTIILLSISFILVTIEDRVSFFSGLIAIMAVGCTINTKDNAVCSELSEKYSKLWIGGEVLLFALVGAAVDVKYALGLGALSVAVLLSALLFRMAGVYVSTLGTNFNFRQRLFCMIAYSPKATVQAAISSVPLSLGLACGSVVLCVGVTAIIFTAPVGAFLIDITYKKLLKE